MAADEALDELELEELLEDDALLEPPQALSASAPATAMFRNAEVFLTDAFIVLSLQGGGRLATTGWMRNHSTL